MSCRHGRGSSKLAWYRYKLPKNYALNYYGNLLLEKDERRYTKVSARINSGRHECGKKHITSICRIWVLNAGINMSCKGQYERTGQSRCCKTSESMTVIVNCRLKYCKRVGQCLAGAVDPWVPKRSLLRRPVRPNVQLKREKRLGKFVSRDN